MRHAMIGLALAMTLGGCGAPSPSGPAVEPLRIAAASDLQTVMPRLIARFEQRERIEVQATYGASGMFAQQIKQGAPYDLFFSANRKFVADLASDGFVEPVTVRDYAQGTLVMAIGMTGPQSTTSLDDLTNPAIKKVAIANPDIAPYGAAARQALQASGLWDVLEPKRVQAESVRQALQFVQTGNAEVAIVGKAIATVPGVRSVPVDQALYEPLWQSCGVVAGSSRGDDALAFLRFVTEGEGRMILRDAGFSIPDQVR